MPQATEVTAIEPVAALTDTYGGPAPEQVLARLDQADMADVKAILSWRGVVVRGEVCLVDLALKYIRLLQEESCGRCGPCRIGVDILRELLENLAAGQTGDNDPETTVAKIRRLAEAIGESAWCGVANTIKEPIVGLLEVGAEHFAAHAGGLTCEPQTTHGWVTAPCRSTCPSTLDIPAYIFQGLEEHPHLATTVIKRDNPLPGIIGRTCPHPCEKNCSLAPTGHPIAINNIKRWCADRAEDLADDNCASGCLLDPTAGASAEAIEAVGGAGRIAGGPHEVSELMTAQLSQRPVEVTCRLDDKLAACGKKVAVIGAGPAGLSAAFFLARRGYQPTIFEELPVPGGMVHVGIPEYRLPRHVIHRETELIQQEGVEIRYNTRVGRDISWEEIDRDFDATFVGIGAHLGRPLGIPGEDLPGSMDAIAFLRKVALHEPIDIGDDVLVLGGGNSAMDAARTAVRLGAKNVQVVYRRTRNEMPANPWEIEEAEEEGVHFQYLAVPLECKGDEDVNGLVCQQMELGEPDESGRRRPVPTDMAPFVLSADSIFAAVGQKPDFEPFKDDGGIKLNKYGYMDADPYTLMTSKPGVFVGGDAVSGGGTIIEAINAGKVAAKYMDKFMRGEPVVEVLEDKTRRIAVYLGAQDSKEPLAECVDYGVREPMPMVDPEVRKHNFAATELGYTMQQQTTEADRCLRCHRPIVVVA
jgi:NADPH-dependent glutamate synthase beta subunit-like oxidoreductase